MDDLLTSDPAGYNSQPDAQPSESSLAYAELQEYIRQYPFAAEPTYFTRPNRYYGAASTWRSWTANDRAVVSELEATRASDLSIHLYNAFALKRRAGRVPGARKVKSKSRSRGRAASADSNEQEGLIPPETWTAWPLRGEQVPRRPGYESVKNGEVVLPSSAMEEALLVVTMRYARQRWDKRQTVPLEVKMKHEKRDWHIKQEEDDSRAGLDDGDVASEASVQTLSSSDEDGLPQGIQTFTSQAFAADESSSSSDEIVSEGDEENQPMFSADDDRARNLLRPCTRHILTKLDELLTGLHKAREAYSMKQVSSKSRSRSRVIASDDTEGEQSENGHRGRKRKWSDTSGTLPPGRSQSRSRGRSNHRLYGSKGRSLGLRDWSDVIGMAALTGWDTNTIARASERCAKLFGQNMMFRTFREQQSTKEEDDEILGPFYEEQFALGSDGDSANNRTTKHSSNTPERDRQTSHQRARNEITAYIPVRSEPLGDRVLCCPVQSCQQHEYVYTRSTRLYEHIRATHPEFDLDGFKRAMVRGGKRGRYDRSGMYSRSRSRNRKPYVEEEEVVEEEAGQGNGDVHNAIIDEGFSDDMQSGTDSNVEG